jgi:hypothetical protein
MSEPNSPVIRGKTATESPGSIRSLPPVTPGVNKDGRSAYIEVKESTKPNQPLEESDSYFDESQKPRPGSPTHAVAGARTSQELLRRLSLPMGIDAVREFKNTNPRARYANLNLSGRIISATFVVPFNIKISQSGEWVGFLFSFILIFLMISRISIQELVLRLYLITFPTLLRTIHNGIIFLLVGQAKS